MPGSNGTIEWGDLLSSRRRVLISSVLLEDTEEPIDVGELATRVARLESPSEGPPDSGLRQSVYTTSTQYHLPRLDAANIVDYDSTTVSSDENLRRFYALAVLIPGSEVRSHSLSP